MEIKASCLLLEAKGRYYYAEEFGKFIELERWEYEKILHNPYLYSFSTALVKHAVWCIARDEQETLTFSQALGYTSAVKEEQVYPSDNAVPSQQNTRGSEAKPSVPQAKPMSGWEQLKRKVWDAFTRPSR